MGCPFLIRFSASKDGEKLVVTSVNGDHNHDVSEVICEAKQLFYLLKFKDNFYEYFKEKKNKQTVNLSPY